MAGGKERLNIIIQEADGTETRIRMYQHRGLVLLPRIGEFLTIRLEEKHELKVVKIDYDWFGDSESGGTVVLAENYIYCERVLN